MGISDRLRYPLANVWGFAYQFLRRLEGAPPRGTFRILVFHDVPTEQRDAFARLLRYLLDVHGVLTPDQAEASLAGHGVQVPGGRIPCLLTFDDGFKSNVAVATEILDRCGVKAVFFLCPGLMNLPQEGQREAIATCIFDRPLGQANVPRDLTLMSWSDAESLARSGHTIGAHTALHRRVSRLGREDQQREIIAPADLLEGRLRTRVTWFAYPFGNLRSIDAHSLRVIAQRYRFCCSGLRGVNSTTTPDLGLTREHVDLTAPFEYQKLVVAGGLDFLYRKSVTRLAAMTSR